MAKMMAKFKTYMVTNLMSFAVLILVFAVFDLTGETLLNGVVALRLFLLTTCVAVAMFFTDGLPIENKWLVMLVDIGEIMAVVFGLGGAVLGLVPLNWHQFLLVTAIILIVYFSVTGILVIRTQADAKEINKLIRLKNRKDQGNG